ncbi:anti-sigma factor family protein [Streptomyces omiyaensis]|uniref:anti-sigma factor family protein n=1 Tax=Streptomyces omiyaensis TaxID=68247 RepID=UPI0036FBA8DB
MTTTDKADTAQHPDVSEISDLTEGLLSPSRSAAVRRHLDGCPLCADVRSSLEEIRGLLGTLPGPPRMPAEIAGRIDAALAAEALLDATAPDSAHRVSRETAAAADDAVSRETAHSTSTRSGSARTAASSRPQGRPGGATGPGRGGTRHRGRIALLSGLAGTLVAVVCAYSLYAVTQNGSSTTHGVAADAPVSAPVGAFSGEPVEDRVAQLLSGDAALTPKGDQPESLSAEETGRVGTAQRNSDTALPSCVLAGTGRQDTVLASERGEYEGVSAYLLVLPDRTDGNRVQTYVVDASCSGDTPAKLLQSASYPKP